MKNNMVLTVIIVIVVGAAAFFGGMKYGQTQASSASGGLLTQGGQGGPNGQRGAGNGGRRGGFGGGTVGKIVTQDANSITVQLQDGSSKIVNIAKSTAISKMTAASQSDLTAGQTVAAFGTTNSDGSITATRIQLNPMTRADNSGGRNPQPTQ